MSSIRGTKLVYLDKSGKLYSTWPEAPEGSTAIYVETPWVERVPETMIDIAEDIAAGYATLGHLGYRDRIPTGRFTVVMNSFKDEINIR